MGLDTMRGSGRCPPFVVAGLIVISLIFAFNWWSLSTQNNDLIKQLEHLGEQLKICSEEQDVCVHQRLSTESRIKGLDGEIATLRVHQEQDRAENEEVKKKLSDVKEELRSLNKEHQDVQKTAVLCNTELESLKKLDISKDGTIATLRLEKERFGTQLDERKQETQKLRVTIQQMEAELKAGQAHSRGTMKIPIPKNAPIYNLPNGHLEILGRERISVRPVGFNGIVPHRENIMPQDPPNPVRPKPQFSVTYLTKGLPSVPAVKIETGDMSVGGNHERAQAQDVDKAENEENNAGERGDETNIESDPGEGQLEEAERMEEANDVAADESPKKSGIEAIANRI